MLFYRAWRESRAMFLMGLLGLAAACLFTLEARSSSGLSSAAYADYVDATVFNGLSQLFFTLLAIFLGVGGLQRERVLNTAIFTLALPVSRFQLVVSQVAVRIS